MTKQVIRRHGDLEIDENPPFQNATWVVERVAWAVLFVILAAAVAGLFGHGPASRAQARTPGGGLEVDYPRLSRLDAPDEIELRFRAPGAGFATVEFDGDFSRDFVVESVQPEPVAQRPHRGGVSLDFEADDGDEQRVVVHVRPRRPAFPTRAQVGLRGQPPVEIAAVVFP